MATFTKLDSGSWRVQVRRKRQYAANTFLRRHDAEEWARDVERSTDKGIPVKRARPNEPPRIFSDLITLHIDDLTEVGKPIRRWKGAVVEALKVSLGRVKIQDLTRERWLASLGDVLRNTRSSGSKPNLSSSPWMRGASRSVRGHAGVVVGCLSATATATVRLDMGNQTPNSISGLLHCTSSGSGHPLTPRSTCRVLRFLGRPIRLLTADHLCVARSLGDRYVRLISSTTFPVP
jgi:hypothetical protein